VGSKASVGYAVVTDAGVRLREAVGSGSVLLRAGRDLATCEGSADVSRPRTMIAWDAARSRIWLLTVDGRGWEAPVSRYGLTYRQITEAARALGASEAVMVDGGGSTTMALRGSDGVVRRVDAPANAPQREIPDGLVLVPR
jgi:exopolysaccharide biosynthesis protein